MTARRVAIFLEDRESFAAALFGAWAAGQQVFLPGDVLPATVEALTPLVDAWITEGSPLPAAVTGELPREFGGLVVFTSGSTGAPTAIPKKLRQLFDEVKTLEATFGPLLTPDTRLFSTVSHQHIYGLLFSVLWPRLTGRPMTPRRLEYPEEIEAAIATGPCVLISSPAHLKRLPEPGPATSLPALLRAVFSSGGPLPEEGAARAIAVLGHQPIEILGSSETGGVAWRQGTTASWRALAGVDYRRSAEGVLELRSPHLPDDTWFTTADRIELTGETFRLLGRADRIAKIEEKRVSLELLERTALATGLVTEARVVVLPGARVTLGLVVVPARALDRKQLIEQLKLALEKAVERVALPRRFRLVDSLPVNAQGKVTEASLKALFNEGNPQPRWAERTSEHARLELVITDDLKVLDGHFEKAAVVPGVAQVDWAIGWGREAFGFTGLFTRMEVLKFQALMMPGHAVKLALDWNAAKSTLSFKFTSETASYSSGKVVFAS